MSNSPGKEVPTSTYSRMAPMTIPGGKVVGKSLSECTTRSTSPDSRLFSSSLTGEQMRFCWLNGFQQQETGENHITLHSTSLLKLKKF